MAQIKIYGLATELNKQKQQMSKVIHSCVTEAFNLPENKRFHRFFPLDEDNFFFMDGRTKKYTIVEISIFEGRSVEAKKKLLALLFEKFKSELEIEPVDLEITIFETPKHNWGIRGLPGDELTLNYKTNV